MSDEESDRGHDYKSAYATVNLQDIAVEESANGDEEFESEGRPMVNQATDIESDGQEDHSKQSKPTSYYKPRPKKDRRTSLIWTKFTIIDKQRQIATCNICDQRMSIKSTSGNLRKHLERKHGFSIKLGVLPRKKSLPRIITPTPRPKVSELAGISDDGITVKVVGENGEEEHFQVLGGEYMAEEVVQADGQEHDYSTIEHQEEEENGSNRFRIGKVTSLYGAPRSSYSKQEVYVPPRSLSHMDDKTKRKRIMELQMECLENKKYNMQLEALLMEQQLNLPRSIFTQPLQYADVHSRGTQTDVGGSDTRVFYVTDKRGGRPIQQLFAYQDLDEF